MFPREGREVCHSLEKCQGSYGALVAAWAILLTLSFVIFCVFIFVQLFLFLLGKYIGMEFSGSQGKRRYHNFFFSIILKLIYSLKISQTC